MKTFNLFSTYFYSRNMLFSMLFILSFQQYSIAQMDWNIDANTAGNLSAGVYLQDLERVLFISGTDLLFYPINGAEQTTGNLSNFGEFPSDWNEITAAVLWNTSTVLLFNGQNYVSLDINQATLSPAKKFPGLPSNWSGRLDAAVSLNKQMMFFAGGQYVVYDKKQKTFTEPKFMSDWNEWTGNWSDGPQTIVNPEDGNLYFFNTNECMVFNVLQDKFEGQPFSIAPDLPPGELIDDIDDGPPSEDISSTSRIDTPEPKRSNTDNWCLTGNPPGNSDADLFADVIYMKNGAEGNEMIDETPQGARLAEIRVWGKWVINGIQTVLETPDGERIELPILGNKKGATSSFKLSPDECLIGINGTHIGPDGRFIHTLQFETTKGQSKVFGSTRGRRSFTVNIPKRTSFFGFAIHSKNFLTSIGIKYVGYDDGSVVMNTKSSTDSDSEVSTSKGGHEKKDEPTDEWRDDYTDFLSDLMDLSWGSADAIKQLPASDWLGKGIDILTIDPLDIGKSDTKTPPIDLTTSEKIGGPTMDKALPIGSDYTTMGGGSDENEDRWVEKYSDFTTQYGGSVGAGGGFGPIQGSLSTSFKNMNNTKVGSKEIYLTRHVTRKLFNVDLKLFWRQTDFGKARQKLNLDFRALVDKLEVPSSIPNRSFANMKKGKPLPSNIERIRDQYQEIIDNFGTHFVKKAIFGGKYVSSTIITKKEYENSRENEQGFKASIQAAVGPATLGTNAEFNYKTKTKTGLNSGTLKSKVYAQGAAASTKFETWDAGLEKSPAVIEVELLETYQLLTKIFFPNDPDIKKKMKILKMVTEQYAIDNGLPPSQPDGKFFTEPKPIEYKYTVTISSIHNPGSETFHYYGDISCDFIGDNILGQSMWMKPEHDAVEVLKNGDTPIMEDYSIKLKEGAKGYFTVKGNLSERGWWPDYSIPIGDNLKKIELSEIPDEGKDFSIHGFSTGGKNAEIKFRIDKQLIY